MGELRGEVRVRVRVLLEVIVLSKRRGREVSPRREGEIATVGRRERRLREREGGDAGANGRDGRVLRERLLLRRRRRVGQNRGGVGRGAE